MTNIGQNQYQSNETKGKLCNSYQNSFKKVSNCLKKEAELKHLRGISLSYPDITRFVASILAPSEWKNLKHKPCLIRFQNNLNDLELGRLVSFDAETNTFNIISVDGNLPSFFNIPEADIKSIHRIEYITFASCL